MLDFPEEDMVITERAALVAWRLAHGEAMSTDDAAAMVGVARSTAHEMLCKMARVLPIRCYNGLWEAFFYSEVKN